MAGAWDRLGQTPENDHDPTHTLDFEGGVDESLQQAGGKINNIFSALASLFGIDNLLSFVISFLQGTLNPATIWSTVTSVFIKPLGFFADLIGGFLSALQIPILDPTKILNLPGLFTSVTSGFANLFNGWFGGTTAVGTPAEVTYVIESVKHAVINGYDVETFTTNDTWIVPANLVECWYVCIGGGGRGGPGGAIGTGFPGGTTSTTRPGGVPGIGGGYIAEQITPATLIAGASVPVTIGIGSTTPGVAGGATSVGSTSSTPGKGLISSPWGYILSTSLPADGGAGGDALYSNGGATPYAHDGIKGGDVQTPVLGGAGGVGVVGTTGPGNNGGNGTTASLLLATKIGGAGGGGGGALVAPSGLGGTAAAGNGGAGGYPGGGSGGGGACIYPGSFNTAVAGGGGVTPNGCAFIMYKTG